MIHSALLLLTGLLGFSFMASAQDYPRVKQRYMGIMEVREFDQFKTVQNLEPYRRRTLDITEVEMELEVLINEISKIELEVEIEHGGTGTALEFDNFEEFGEFESEVEKGGEISISEVFYHRKLSDSTALIVGKAPLYVSLTSAARKPLLNVATSPSNLEERMIPVKWSEPGLQLESRLSDFTIRGGVVAGLNSEFFRKYSWIGGGHQRQFEHSNIDDVAATATLEYGDVARGRGLALAHYYGNTRNNRHKKDKLNENAHVALWTLMGSWTLGPITATGEAIRGTLQNSEAVVVANATLGGLAKPKNFASLGASAALDVLQIRWDLNESWAVFGQWERVNTFQEIQGQIFADPRYDVRQEGGGLWHTWDDVFFWKFHYWKEQTRLEGLPATETYLVQFGFDTGEF